MIFSEQIIIRTATINDVDALAGLLDQLFSIENDFTFNIEKQKNGLMMMLDGCGRHRSVKVAQYKKKLVGMCSAQTRISTAQGGITAVIEDLIVDSDFRNKGIGNRLLSAILGWAEKRNIQHFQLLADKDNTPALSFYKRLNWNHTRLICLTKTIA